MSKQRVDKTEEEWTQKLTADQISIWRQKGTERALSGKYYQ